MYPVMKFTFSYVNFLVLSFVIFLGIEEGSKRRLCCDVKVSQPLLNTTITLEWYYYKQLDTFGSRGYTVVQVCVNVLIYLNNNYQSLDMK